MAVLEEPCSHSMFCQPMIVFLRINNLQLKAIQELSVCLWSLFSWISSYSQLYRPVFFGKVSRKIMRGEFFSLKFDNNILCFWLLLHSVIKILDFLNKNYCRFCLKFIIEGQNMLDTLQKSVCNCTKITMNTFKYQNLCKFVKFFNQTVQCCHRNLNLQKRGNQYVLQ